MLLFTQPNVTLQQYIEQNYVEHNRYLLFTKPNVLELEQTKCARTPLQVSRVYLLTEYVTDMAGKTMPTVFPCVPRPCWQCGNSGKFGPIAEKIAGGLSR